MTYWGNNFNPNEKFYIVNKVYVEQLGIKISKDYFVKFKCQAIVNKTEATSKNGCMVIPTKCKFYFKSLKKLMFGILVLYLKLRYAYTPYGEIMCETYIEELETKEK